jgi:hypothetical protein
MGAANADQLTARGIETAIRNLAIPTDTGQVETAWDRRSAKRQALHLRI